jgi:hypothetical protein
VGLTGVGVARRGVDVDVGQIIAVVGATNAEKDESGLEVAGWVQEIMSDRAKQTNSLVARARFMVVIIFSILDYL